MTATLPLLGDRDRIVTPEATPTLPFQNDWQTLAEAVEATAIFVPNGTGAVASTVQAKLRERVSILDFGADPTGATSSQTAMDAARAYVAANATRYELIFPAGIYKYAVSPNWGIANASIVGEGEVRLRYTGTGNAVILDAGPLAADLIYGTRMEGFLVEAPSTAGHGVYVRSIHHGRLGFNVRGCGTSSAGIKVAFAVCTRFVQPTVSVNEGGWYNSGSGAAKPAIGIDLDTRTGAEFCSYCTFENPIIEGPPIGIQLSNTLGNVFWGGTAEACLTYGVFASTAARQDRFFGTDFEANTGADVYCNGNDVKFIECDSNNLIAFGTSAKRSGVHGGLHNDILVDLGASGCSVTNLFVNRLLDGLGILTNAGTSTIIRDVRDADTRLHVRGSGFRVESKSATYTETARTGDVLVKCSNTMTVNLPTAVGNTAMFHFKLMTAASTLTLDGSGTETIDGALTLVTSTQYATYTLVSDGANWMIV